MMTLEKSRTIGSVSEHLANERTFLAWIRTSIGIMGFGFVVVKFSLFVKQISVALGTVAPTAQTAYSHIIGIMLVTLGGITIAAAFVRYNKTKRQLDHGIYYHSTVFIKLITASIVLLCLALLAYLLKTT